MESLSWRFILSQTVKMKLCIARRITMTRGKLVLLDKDRVRCQGVFPEIQQ